MNLKKIFGILLISLAILTIIFQPNVTGRAISENEINTNLIFVLVFFVGGILLLMDLGSLVKKTDIEESQLQEIRKFKPCKRVDLKRVKEEIERIKRISRNPSSGESKVYNLHQVPIGREVYLVADAKTLNKETNQSGRGNLRYLFNRSTQEYEGLAKETDQGDYKKIV